MLVFSSSSSSLDISSIDAEVSAAHALGLGHGFGVPFLFLSWHLGLSGQSLYQCPVFLQPKHLPAANSFVCSSSDILCVFAVSNCTSAKINISYSILFNLTTSYSSYFGGKKGISRNK